METSQSRFVTEMVEATPDSKQVNPASKRLEYGC